MKKKVKIIFPIILIALASSAITFYFIEKNSRNNKLIKVSGNIEGDDVRLSFRVQGQIIELLTDEGKVIKKGDVIARLNTDEWSKEKANEIGRAHV